MLLLACGVARWVVCGDALAAVAATSVVSAQSVELYGRIDLGYNSTKVKEIDNSVTTKTKSTSNFGHQNGRTTSRLGFKGTEDLGGGMKAGFVYEFGLKNDNTGSDETAIGNTRLANLTLSGGFGAVTIGTFDNTFDSILTGAGSNAFYLTGEFGPATKATNAIQYQSPNVNGFTFGIGMAGDKSKTDDEVIKGSGYILSTAYNAGPLSVTAAFGNASAKDETSGIEFADDEYLTNDKVKGKSSAFKASYNLGVAVPYVIYSSASAKTKNVSINNDGDFGNLAADSAKIKTSGYEVGATFPMGAFTPYVAIAKGSSKAKLDDLSGKAKFSGHQIGTTYSLSKRTYVYAAVGSKKWKNSDDGYSEKTSDTKIGLVHSF